MEFSKELIEKYPSLQKVVDGGDKYVEVGILKSVKHSFHSYFSKISPSSIDYLRPQFLFRRNPMPLSFSLTVYLPTSTPPY